MRIAHVLFLYLKIREIKRYQNFKIMNYSKFYIQFGKLLYAIAKSDGKVQEEEIDEFYRIVKRELQAIQDKSGTNQDNSIFTEFEFEQLVFADADKEKTFEAFLDFIRKNSGSITPEIRELCIESVRRVALAYNGIVMQEQDMIDRLNEAFDA